MLAALLCFSHFSNAQNDKLSKAVQLTKTQALDSAKIYIDAAALHLSTSTNPYTWYAKGFIYYELFKRQSDTKSFREQALSYFKKSIELDQAAEYSKDNLDYIRIIAESFYNEAVSAMDSVKYNFAVENYSKYKENMKLVNPALTFILKDIEFNMALASIYIQIYETQHKEIFLKQTTDLYNRILNQAAADDTSITNNPYIWQTKGLIYKELYKKKEKLNKNSPYRVLAFDCLKKSIALDKSSQHLKSNVNAIKFLSYTFKNDAMDTTKIDLNSYNTGLENFTKYTQSIKFVNPSINTQADEIEFFNHMGLNYFTEFNKNNSPVYAEMIKKSFDKVLELDSNNYRANYNLGILYHNQAVEIINRTDYDVDINKLDAIQDEAIVLLRKSLPFMKKAYELNPNRKETILGLQGIYYALNDYEKSSEFKAKMEGLEQK